VSTAEVERFTGKPVIEAVAVSDEHCSGVGPGSVVTQHVGAWSGCVNYGQGFASFDQNGKQVVILMRLGHPIATKSGMDDAVRTILAPVAP
jgi:hypothetical protein